VNSAAEIYERLIAPIEDRMMRTVARLVRDPDDSLDAFQNVLMMIWKDLKKINAHPNPHGYILRMCVSAAYDQLRRRSRQRHQLTALEGEIVVRPGAARDPQSISISHERERQIMEAIAMLPRQQAQAVLLQIVNDESYDEIARSLGCTEATARSHLSKGKAKLREILGHLRPARREVKA
jgi:RNA polymerase sigma factor (sigma-70 family)